MGPLLADLPPVTEAMPPEAADMRAVEANDPTMAPPPPCSEPPSMDNQSFGQTPWGFALDALPQPPFNTHPSLSFEADSRPASRRAKTLHSCHTDEPGSSDHQTSIMSDCSSRADSVYSTDRSQNSKFTTAPRFTFAGGASRFTTSKAPKTVGPGDYDVANSKCYLPDMGFGAGAAFARGGRPQFRATSGPGPGAHSYDKSTLGGPSASFGTPPSRPSSRTTSRASTPAGEPGPGDHNCSPRHYLPNTLGLGAGATFFKSKVSRMSKSSSAPGPGEYSPRKALVASGPKAAFGTASRDDVPKSRKKVLGSEPGPGSYDHANFSSLSGYKVASKFSLPASRRKVSSDSKMSTSPGPCTYDLQRVGSFGM